MKKGFLTCDFVGLLIGGQKVILRMKGTLSRGYMPCTIATSPQILDESFLLVAFLKDDKLIREFYSNQFIAFSDMPLYQAPSSSTFCAKVFEASKNAFIFSELGR